MTLISDNNSLQELCKRLANERYIAVDTEFMRERTYFPKLCLIQIAGETDAAAIDPLAPGIQLEPVLDLLYNSSITKVFHACRQDMEIFFNLTQTIPCPIFDTQIGAMVCGHGDSVSYDRLVKQLLNIDIDKTSRFTDWSQRPLSSKQLDYALSDVIHLRNVFECLEEQLKQNGRRSWLEEEFDLVENPQTYTVDPKKMWLRLKIRSGKPRFLILVRELAAFRETEAQRLDIPRNRVLRDDVLLDIAARSPRTTEDLVKVRNMTSRDATGSLGIGVLETIEASTRIPESAAPKVGQATHLRKTKGAMVELLKVLLKLKSEDHNVAQKLIASTSDLEAIANSDNANVTALMGWRRELFGNDALLLKSGKLALSAYENKIKLLDLRKEE